MPKLYFVNAMVVMCVQNKYNVLNFMNSGERTKKSEERTKKPTRIIQLVRGQGFTSIHVGICESFNVSHYINTHATTRKLNVSD